MCLQSSFAVVIHPLFLRYAVSFFCLDSDQKRTTLRMSGCKASGEQAAQYADQLPDEGSAVTRRDTTSPEGDQRGPGRTLLTAMRLKDHYDAIASLPAFDRMHAAIASLSASDSTPETEAKLHLANLNLDLAIAMIRVQLAVKKAAETEALMEAALQAQDLELVKLASLTACATIRVHLAAAGSCFSVNIAKLVSLYDDPGPLGRADLATAKVDLATAKHDLAAANAAETAAAAAVFAAAAAVDKLASLSTAEKKRPRTTRQATETRPALLSADAPLTAALEAIPAEYWGRTWAACRTLMLRRTSKRVKEVVDKMRLPAVVCLSRRFWKDGRNGTEEEQRQFFLRQLTVITARFSIITLKLTCCGMRGQNVCNLAGVLAQCQALAHLDLSSNYDFGEAGVETLAGVLGKCRKLVHLDLSGSGINAAGATQMLGQCTALVHLNLSANNIFDPENDARLAGVLGQCTALAHLDLSSTGS